MECPLLFLPLLDANVLIASTVAPGLWTGTSGGGAKRDDSRLIPSMPATPTPPSPDG